MAVAAALAPALILVAAAAPAPRFAPVVGQAYRLTIENRPAAGGGAYVFTGGYDLAFAPDGAGWTATLTLRRVAASAPAAMVRMFEAGQRPLLDRPMRFHLDAAGRIVGLDDEEALIRRYADAVAGMAAGRSADGSVDRATAARLAAPLLALPPERRRAFLGSPLVAAVAAADAGRAVESGRPVTVPATVSGPALRGTQDVIHEATGSLVIRTRAEGGDSGARTRLLIERRIDPAHGLLLREERTVATAVADGAGAPDVTVTTLVPVS